MKKITEYCGSFYPKIIIGEKISKYLNGETPDLKSPEKLQVPKLESEESNVGFCLIMAAAYFIGGYVISLFIGKLIFILGCIVSGVMLLSSIEILLSEYSGGLRKSNGIFSTVAV